MNRDEIIEVGARASFARFSRQMAASCGLTVIAFDDMDPIARRQWLDEAATQHDAMVPLIRAQVAEEIAVAQELAAGERCPQCRGKVASRKWVRGHILSRCGCGNSWDDKSGRFVEYPKIARQIGEQR